MHATVEESAAQQRGKNFRKKQIGNRLQEIASGGMSCDIDAQAAQLLDKAPYLGTVGGNLLGDFGAADYDGWVLHQEMHDAAKADVSGVVSFRLSGLVVRSHTSCFCFLDAGIMRDVWEKHNQHKERF